MMHGENEHYLRRIFGYVGLILTFGNAGEIR